jgi:hypothetical protein
MRVTFIRSLSFAVGFLFLSTAALAQVGLSVTIAPPELQIDEQTICPGDGYIWTPGYWAWDGDYYWVPGEWIMPPEIGFLWTPGYWGRGGEGFLFNEGYWGPSVGFYGGIDYGYGYFGHGYEGGRWTNGRFFYNTTLNRVNFNINHNFYNARVDERVNRVSYNGGNGGIDVRATAQESGAARDRHVAPVAAQRQYVQTARSAPQQRFSAPRSAAPAAAPVRAARPAAPLHASDLPALSYPAAPNTGNPKLDQKYQRQQQQLITTQTQDRMKLAQRQTSEHQQLAKQPAAAAAKAPQLEQLHQQQTQQLQQKHTQQTQQMQQRQQPAAAQRGGGRGDRRQ